MTDLAINDKGDALFFDGREWKPAPVAQNDKGERMAFDGKEWRPIAAASAKPIPGIETAKAIGNAVNTGVNWAGTQITKGVTGLLGGADALGTLADRGATWAGDKIGLPETGRNVGAALKSNLSMHGLAPNTEAMNSAIFGSLGVPEVNAGDNPAFTLTNPLGIEGKVNVGKMLDVGAQAVAGGAPFMKGAAAAIPAFTGGMTSEAAGQATDGTPWELPARIFGALPGAFVGSKIATPLPARLSAEEARNVQIAKEAGVPLTVGQETGRGRAVESALARFPTSAGVMADAADNQATSVARAASGQAGTVVDNVGPEAMKTVHRNASNAFERAKQFPEDITLKPDFFNEAGRKVGAYVENTAESAIVPAVRKRLDDFFDPKLMKGGNYPTLTNEQYQEFRHGINTALENTTEGGARKALKGIRNALDDAAEASLPADKMEAWKEARKNWANYKVLAKATSGGSVDSRSSGTLSPNALTSALKQAQGPDKFAEATGGMNDVARMSGYLADTMPNSGTPQTLQMQRLLSGGALTGAAGGGFAFGGIPGALAAGGAVMVPNLVARAMTGRGAVSRAVRDYLANQALADPRRAIASVPFTLAPNVLTDQRRQ